jgi:hypothetical protein
MSRSAKPAGLDPGAGCPAARCDLAALPRLVYVMQYVASIMRLHSKSVTRRMAAALGMSVALVGCLAGCMFDAPPRARTAGGCFVGGCAAEVCSNRGDVVTPCLWRDAYVCFRDAVCERQTDGECGWTQSAELRTCLASHDPLPQ